MKSIIISDIDNTLYNFVNYFAPCFRAMVHALSKSTKISETTLTAAFRQVYANHGSVEYRYAIEELHLFRAHPRDELEKLINLGRVAFSRTARHRLTPYPGVTDGLSWARAAGIPVIGFTNAPLRYALWRLGQLGLSSYFTSIAAFEGHKEPRHIADNNTDQSLDELSQRYRSPIKRRIVLKEHELKPSPAGYKAILAAEHNKFDETYVIGDSQAKDLAPAMELGAIGIWAKYGTEFDSENMDTLLQITPWTESKIRQAYDMDKQIEPDFTIEAFEEIQTFIPPRQLSIFG